jgi:hypothetical protein
LSWVSEIKPIFIFDYFNQPKNPNLWVMGINFAVKYVMKNSPF